MAVSWKMKFIKKHFRYWKSWETARWCSSLAANLWNSYEGSFILKVFHTYYLSLLRVWHHRFSLALDSFFSNQQCIQFFRSLFVLFFPSFLLFSLLAVPFYFSIIQKTPWVSSKVKGLQWEIENDNLELLLLESPFNLLSFRTGTRRKWKLPATKDYIFTTRKTKFYWVSHLQVIWHGCKMNSMQQSLVNNCL